MSKFQLLTLGMLAWALGDLVSIALMLARHVAPDDPITMWRHIIGIPVGMSFNVWGFFLFWKGWRADRQETGQ